jgi:hypothetical protein
MEMTFTKTKLALATALALGLGYAGLAPASTAFVNGGVGGAVQTSGPNGGDGNYLINDFSPAAASLATGTDFAFLGQATTSFGGVATPAGREYTMTFAILLNGTLNSTATPNQFNAELSLLAAPALTCVAGTPCSTAQASLGTIAGGGANYFQIFYDAANSNLAAGTGFNNGTLILQGHFVNDFPAPLTTGQGTSLSVTNNSSPNVSGKSAPLLQLDNSTVQNPTNTNPANVASIQATGSTNFNIEIDYSNPAFFPQGPTFLTAGFVLQALQPALNAPNTNREASLSFADVIAGVSPDYGDDTVANAETATPGLTHTAPVATTWTVNNAVCGTPDRCDFQANGGLSGTFISTPLPEPGSVALIGLGMGLAGLGMRRRKARS